MQQYVLAVVVNADPATLPCHPFKPSSCTFLDHQSSIQLALSFPVAFLEIPRATCHYHFQTALI